MSGMMMAMRGKQLNNLRKPSFFIKSDNGVWRINALQICHYISFYKIPVIRYFTTCIGNLLIS